MIELDESIEVLGGRLTDLEFFGKMLHARNAIRFFRLVDLLTA